MQAHAPDSAGYEVRRITTAERMPPPTMSISGRTPSNIGETGPPVFGSADAEGVALAVELAVAVALMLADELLLADALDIALGLDVAEAEALGLDIMLLPIICELLIICPLGIMCIPFICCAIAAGAKASTATMHRDANKRNFLKMPPSVDFPSLGSTCTFPSGGHVRQITKPPSMYV